MRLFKRHGCHLDLGEIIYFGLPPVSLIRRRLSKKYSTFAQVERGVFFRPTKLVETDETVGRWPEFLRVRLLAHPCKSHCALLDGN